MDEETRRQFEAQQARLRLVAHNVASSLQGLEELGVPPIPVANIPAKLDELAGKKPTKAKGRPPSKKVAERRQKVGELHSSGMAPGEIAAKLGVNVNTIKSDIKRLKS